ncbi:hypothetical protein Esti_003592 [Eimeria stiedai]
MGTSGHAEEEQLDSLSLRSGNLQELLLLQRLGLECPSDDARLLDLQRQLYDVTTELEFKKAAYAQVVEKARKQGLDLQKKQGQLKAQLQRFQRFVYTNEEKTIRANKRAAADREICQVRTKELAVLQRQLTLDELTCAQVESQVQDLQKFADYLAAVANASPEFSCVGDVMARFEALTSVHAGLLEREEKTSQAMDCLRQEMKEYKRNQAAKILEANNKVALYQRELEALEKEATALSAKAEEASNDSFTRSLQLGKVLLAVENMFATCIKARPCIQHGRAVWERQRREAAAAGEGEAPQEAGAERQQKERQGGKKEGAPEGTQLQRRCRDAMDLLAAIRCLIADFRDIEEQLNKGEKKKQKAFRTVNMALEKSDEDVVEFVATRVLATTRKDTGIADISKKTVSRRLAEDNSGYQQSMRIYGVEEGEHSSRPGVCKRQYCLRLLSDFT